MILAYSELLRIQKRSAASIMSRQEYHSDGFYHLQYKVPGPFSADEKLQKHQFAGYRILSGTQHQL